MRIPSVDSAHRIVWLAVAPPAVTSRIPRIIEDISRPIFKRIVVLELLPARKLMIMPIPLLQLHLVILL